MNHLQSMITQKLLSLKNNKILLILILSTTYSLIYYSWGIWDWKFSFVGDEWPFYFFALQIIDEKFFMNPLSIKGVYAQHYILSSMYQALFLLVNPSQIFWKLSNIFLIIPITYFIFKSTKILFGNHVALLSTLLLQSSFFISNYFKIGYINPQAFALYMALWYYSLLFYKFQRTRDGVVAGVLFALSFYTYIGPIFPLFFFPYFLIPFFSSERKLVVIKKLALTGAVYLFLLIPGLTEMSLWGGASTKTVFFREYEGNMQIFINVIQSFGLFYKNHDYYFNHFISGPYLDICTRLFAAGGTIMVLFLVDKKNYLLFFSTYILTVLGISITSPYSYTATTRGIFYIPFGAILAAIFLSQITLPLGKFRDAVTIFIISSIFLINLLMSQYFTFNASGFSTTSLLLKDLMENSKSPALVLSTAGIYNSNNLTMLQKIYPVKSYMNIFYLDTLQCQDLYKIDQIYFLAHDSNIKNGLKKKCVNIDTKYFKIIDSPIQL